MGRKSLGEVQARRTDVYEMLMAGKPKSFIVSYCATNYGIRLSAVEKDIAAVRLELKEEFTKQKETIIETHISRYENLYAFYMDAGTEDEPNLYYNPSEAAKMLEKKEKLLQLHRPDVNINIDKSTTNNIEKQLVVQNSVKVLDFDEIKKLLEVSDAEIIDG